MTPRLKTGIAMALVAACGGRTTLGVLVDEPPVEAGADVQVGYRDASTRDAFIDFDAFVGIDAAKLPANKSDCPDSGATRIFLLAQNGELLSFYPPDLSFTQIGQINCPGGPPNSMAVDRKGVAWVVNQSGSLFKVSTVDASCKATSFVVNQMGFGSFGMGFTTIGAGPAEQLFIASSMDVIGSIDTTTLKVSTSGPLTPVPPMSMNSAELTGTGDGRLYAWFGDGMNGSIVAEVDKTTGKILGEDDLPTVDQGFGWAFASWGEVFYLFTTPVGQATWKYDPATKIATEVTHYMTPIVGAGVSTCAP